MRLIPLSLIVLAGLAGCRAPKPSIAKDADAKEGAQEQVKKPFVMHRMELGVPVDSGTPAVALGPVTAPVQIELYYVVGERLSEMAYRELQSAPVRARLYDLARPENMLRAKEYLHEAHDSLGRLGFHPPLLVRKALGQGDRGAALAGSAVNQEQLMQLVRGSKVAFSRGMKNVVGKR